MSPATDATVISAPTDQSFSVKARNMSAFAAVCVMIIHAGNGGMGSFAAKMMHQFFGWGVCTFAVPWFFFASGYFLGGHLGEPNWWTRAMSSRLRTLVLPYALWCGIFILFSTTLGVLASPHGDLALPGLPAIVHALFKGFGLDFSEHPSLVPFWYIRALMIIVLFSPVLVWALRRWKWCVPAAMLPAYVYCCAVNNCHVMPWFLFYSPFSLAGWIYFSMGLLVRMYGCPKLVHRIGAKTAWAGALAIICAGRFALYSRQPEFAGVAWLAGIPLLMLGTWRLMPAVPLPTWFTSSAFPVYALHYFVAYSLEHTILPIAHPAWWAYPLRAAMIIVASFALAHALRKFPAAADLLFGGR